MNYAIVYDRVNKFGGAERVLSALGKLYPGVPLFTSVYDASDATSWARSFHIRTTFLQHIPFARKHHEWLVGLMPIAFESLNIPDDINIVISVSSAEAKSIITRPDTVHICYCLTPTRFLWSGYETYQMYPGWGRGNALASLFLRFTVDTLRRWDLFAATRPDYYVAISSRVKKRIETYYHRKVDAVIYPPVDTDFFVPKKTYKKSTNDHDYYITVSRLVGYKRIDLLIDAFNYLHKHLYIVGTGNDLKRLTRRAGSTIRFITEKLTDTKLREYYQECRAFVYAADEDFGIAMAEAQSCGKPVIAYRESGASEIIDEGNTGVLYNSQTPESFIEALKVFEGKTYDESVCRRNALRFSRQSFLAQIQTFINQKGNSKTI